MDRPSWKSIFAVRREEAPFAAAMFAYFLLVIASFWVLKPLKKALFLEYYDGRGLELHTWTLTAAEAELLVKVLNLATAALAVAAFSMLARRLQRDPLTLVLLGFFVAGDCLYWQALTTPGTWTVWSFYLFGDLFSTLMVAAFFAFLNDSVSADAAKRLYGIVGLGGVVGGVLGSTVLRAFVHALAPSTWLLVCAGVAIVIGAAATVAGKHAPVRTSALPAPDAAEEPAASAAWRGAHMVSRSSYLFSIVAIVGAYEVASTLMDFQFTSTVAHHLDGDAIRSHLATVFAVTNVTAMLVQLLFTSPVMARYGVGAALLVLPVMAFGGSGLFLVAPMLWTGSLLSVADNAFSYSIHQSAKEALYVPTSRSEKYEAKAFIDMFVMRFAKVLAVFVSLGLAAFFRDYDSVRWLSLVTFVVLVGWIMAARFAGRRFAELDTSPPPSMAPRRMHGRAPLHADSCSMPRPVAALAASGRAA